MQRAYSAFWHLSTFRHTHCLDVHDLWSVAEVGIFHSGPNRENSDCSLLLSAPTFTDLYVYLIDLLQKLPKGGFSFPHDTVFLNSTWHSCLRVTSGSLVRSLLRVHCCSKAASLRIWVFHKWLVLSLQLSHVSQKYFRFLCVTVKEMTLHIMVMTVIF